MVRIALPLLAVSQEVGGLRLAKSGLPLGSHQPQTGGPDENGNAKNEKATSSTTECMRSMFSCPIPLLGLVLAFAAGLSLIQELEAEDKDGTKLGLKIALLAVGFSAIVVTMPWWGPILKKQMAEAGSESRSTPRLFTQMMHRGGSTSDVGLPH